MSALLAVLWVATAADNAAEKTDDKKKDDGVTVESVTVNGDAWQSYPTTADAPNTVSEKLSGPRSGQPWSVVTPRTIGTNRNQLDAAVGFPGAYVSYLRGITPVFDAGARVGVNYGYEGQIAPVEPGLKLALQAKVRFYDNGKVSLGASFALGPNFYFPNKTLVTGFTVPIGLNLGIVASSALNVGVTFEVPLWWRFGTSWGLVIPVLTGAAAEYFLSSNFNVWGALRMGPSLWTNGLPATFTIDARAGVGWRF